MLGSSVTQVFHINKSESIGPDALVPLTTASVHDTLKRRCNRGELWVPDLVLDLDLDLYLCLLFFVQRMNKTVSHMK